MHAYVFCVCCRTRPSVWCTWSCHVIAAQNWLWFCIVCVCVDNCTYIMYCLCMCACVCICLHVCVWQSRLRLLHLSTYVCVLVQNAMLPLVNWPYVYINWPQLQYGCSHRCSMIRILCTLLCGYAGKPRDVLVFQVKVAFPFWAVNSMNMVIIISYTSSQILIARGVC